MKINTNSRWNDKRPVYLDEVAIIGIVLFSVGISIISWLIAGRL